MTGDQEVPERKRRSREEIRWLWANSKRAGCGRQILPKPRSGAEHLTASPQKAARGKRFPSGWPPGRRYTSFRDWHSPTVPDFLAPNYGVAWLW